MSTSPVLSRPTIEKIPVDKLSGLAYWEKLDTTQQHALQGIVQNLSGELVSQWKSVLRAGKFLDEIYEITNPFGAFLRTVKTLWGEYFSSTTAYRYRNIYLAVKDTLSEQVAEAAIASGIKLVGGDEKRPFGRYTEIVKALPPPKKGGKKEAIQWLEEFQKKRAELPREGPSNVYVMGEEVDAREVTKQIFLRIRPWIKRLPTKPPKIRGKVIEDVTGMMMWQAGLSSAQTYHPIAPPQSWQDIKRGRPKIKDQKTA